MRRAVSFWDAPNFQTKYNNQTIVYFLDGRRYNKNLFKKNPAAYTAGFSICVSNILLDIWYCSSVREGSSEK